MGATLPVFAVGRHRMTVDGYGVTSLVASTGCPLNCKYCINKKELENAKPVLKSPEDLYETLKIDDLYFRATGGGVCFGGGESLLHIDFISEFYELIKGEWKITVETSLNVPRKSVEKALNCVDEFIIDIKDINPKIYKSYTEVENDNVIDNLEYLSRTKGSKIIKIRVPIIKGYNSKKDVNKSVDFINSLGFEDIEVFRYIIR